MLQLLKSLRSRTRGKDMTDSEIISWANRKVRIMGRKSQIESFKVPSFTFIKTQKKKVQLNKLMLNKICLAKLQ